MIIDAHCHIYPDKIAEKASLATGRFYGIGINYDGKVSTLLDVGKKAGIDKFIVQSVATTPKQVASINRFIHDTVESNKGTMFGLGTLHPESCDIRGDVEYLIELGLGGVKLHPDIQGFKLDDYRCLKIYEICEEKGLPLLLRRIHEEGMGIILFSGRQKGSIDREIVENVDLLIDGPFIAEKRDFERVLLGSTNKGLHFITGRYKDQESYFYNPIAIEEVTLGRDYLFINGD